MNLVETRARPVCEGVPLAISLLLIKIRCLLLMPLIVPKLKLITCKSEKKNVISFGAFEAEGLSRACRRLKGARLHCERP